MHAGKSPSIKVNYCSGVVKPDATACCKNLGSHEEETILTQCIYTYQEGQTGDSGPAMDKALVLGDDLVSCWGSVVGKNDEKI